MFVFVKSGERRKRVVVKAGALAGSVVKLSEVGVLKVNGKVAHPKKVLKEGDVVEFVRVVYGG